MRNSRLLLIASAAVLAGCAGDSGDASRDPPPIDLVDPPSPPRPPAPESPPEPEPDPEPQAPRADDARPAWWIDLPARAGGRILIAASADGNDLAQARRAAVDAALESLRAEAGGDAEDESTDRTSAIRLNDGRFRVFVLVSARE